MIFAAVDIGTNSCRILITEGVKGKLKVLESKLATTRIGEGIAKSPVLKEEAIERTVRALEEYASILAKYTVNQMRTVATSAVRDAENGQNFVNLVKKRCGLKVDIISGEEEALLSYLGVVRGLDASAKERLVIDLGGGSTELIWRNSSGKLMANSIPIGAVRATEANYGDAELEKMVLSQMPSIGLKDFEIVGVGGTITSLAAIKLGLEKYDPNLVHGFTLYYEDITTILKTLEGQTLEERKKIPGVQAERADIIIAGIKIYKFLLKFLNMDRLTVSETDILYGIIFELEKNNNLT